MNAQEFVFWLNGFIEIGNPETLTSEQLQIVKDHIALVLRKETPHRHAIPRKPNLQDIINTSICSAQTITPDCAGTVTCGNLPKTDINLLNYKSHASC